MTKQVYYRQCSLQRGNSSTVSWIPDVYAVPGKPLKLKGSDGAWVNGWIVQSVSSERVSESLLPDTHDDVKAHRKRTGDSLPRAAE